MADKLIACTCGGQGVTIDAEPPQREVEWCKKHGCEPRRHYAVRCDKCGKQTQSYTIKTRCLERMEQVEPRKVQVQAV